MKKFVFDGKILRNTALLFIVLFCTNLISAQNLCPNIDFSMRNFTNWVCQTANSAGSGNTAYNSLTWTGMAAVNGRHTIITDIYGVDTRTCNGSPNAQLSLVPDGFNQCAKVGDENIGANAENIRYRMAIDTANSLLLLHFAVVFEDPGHSASEQPRFEMRIQDTTGKLLNVGCSSYNVTSGGGIPGFQTCNSSPHWRDWTTVGVSLLGLVGQKIDIVFASADCSQSGHYGYSYMVGECQPMTIEVQFCEGSNVARLTAPAGFTSYIWTTGGSVVGTTRRISVQNPPDGTVYNCAIVSEIGCTSNLTAIIQKTMIAPYFTEYYDTCRHAIRLTQVSYASGSYVSSWTWEIGKPGYGTEFIGDDSTFEYVFKDTGMYTILLTVNTANGCADTHSIRVFSFPDPDVHIFCPETMCKYKETWINATGAVNYTWSSLDSGRILQYNNDSVMIDRGGTYSVVATDERGCYGYDTANTMHKAFKTSFKQQNEPCYNDALGSITIEQTIGGTPPYLYTWQGLGNPDMAREVANSTTKNLKAGKYYLYTIDDIRCVNYDTIEITQPDSMTISLTDFENMRCNKPNGSLNISVEGGTTPYSYSWSNGDSIEDISGLRDGVYQVTVTDAEGCTMQANYEVIAIPNPTIYLDTLINETCDAANGYLSVYTVNGVEPLIYTWTPDGTNNQTNSLPNLSAGTYNVKVTDDLGCTYDTNLVLTNHRTQVITVDNVSPEYCNRTDGAITISVAGDTDYFEYSWLPAEVNVNSNILSNLAAGKYTVTVYDGTCTVSKEIEVPFVEGPVADFVTKTYNVPTNSTFALSDNTQPGGGALSTWMWDLGDGNTESGQIIYHSYAAIGDYYVFFHVIDENACFDTITKKFHVYDELSVFIPNSFTPNGDGLNDTWGPVMQEYQTEGYQMSLYDRWGQQIFYTTDTEERWDGTISGKAAIGNSIYSYKIIVKDFMGQYHEYIGHVTVLR